MAHYLKRADPVAAGDKQAIRETVSHILRDVEKGGIEAVRKHSAHLDDWSPESFRVQDDVIDAMCGDVDSTLKAHIDDAVRRVQTFAELQRTTLVDFATEVEPGITLGQKQIPVQSVGSYSPGGRYPLIASAVMTIAVPKIAGVKRVVACAPPSRSASRGIHPAQLYAIKASGADEVFCIGGVQALAALAYGVDGLMPVDMIVGAGNAYVAEAKRQLFGAVGIDLLAGPTEVLVIVDADGADEELVATDLLAQAEHGPSSPAALLTTSEPFAHTVIATVERVLKSWPTSDVSGAAWRTCGQVVVCDSNEEMATLSDTFAPEHLELFASEPTWFLERLKNYGSLFIGPGATVAFGDKGIGTNHVLPTERAARYTGGLWVGKFLKTVTWQSVAENALPIVAPMVAAISEAEGMLGHAESVRLRLRRTAKADA